MKRSENVSDGISPWKLPDNQQERLKMCGWIVGFVDGEGSFSVSIYRNTQARMRLGWQVFPEFVVTQGEKSVSVLEDFQRIFGCGKIYKAKSRPRDGRREVLYRYCVRSRRDLQEKIIPFFCEHPLRSYKKNEFKKFVRIVAMIERKEHLSERGLKRIARIVETMNHKKSSTFLESSEATRRTV